MTALPDPLPDLSVFAQVAVAVVGDVMLDEYVQGDVSRISAEAPVPILEARRRSAMPGGAANAAASIAALGGAATIVGCVGDDVAGATARDLAGAAGIDASRLVVDPDRDTTVKTRVVARGQQIVRIDHETRRTVSGAVRRELVEAARRAVGEADAVVISDYDKGVVDPEVVQVVVEAAGGKPVVVDPKRPDLSAYRGATVVTPNTAELERAVGYPCPTVDAAVGAARSLLEGLGGAAMLVTLGPLGMVLVAPGAEPFHAPARARTVYDVTGAGDTVVGALALALAAGFAPEEAVQVSSAAAAVAVTKAGTATVTAQEVEAELAGGAGGRSPTA